MTPYQLAVEALKINPERFFDDKCPIENISCANCPFKGQSHFSIDSKSKKDYFCGIDPDYIRNTDITDQLKIDYPEYYL